MKKQDYEQEVNYNEREEKNVFEDLFHINVNDKTQDRNGLTYLSWAYAWAETKKIYPDATYDIYKDENGKPYVFDPDLGYMVFTRVTIEGLTYEMYLPVMDNKNKAMKNKEYSYTTRYGEKTVEAATMTDINKAIMRCLTKNLAMFGLGLYIYTGEDLPEEKILTITDSQKKTIAEELNRTGFRKSVIYEAYKIKDISELNFKQAEKTIISLKKKPDKEKKENKEEEKDA